MGGPPVSVCIGPAPSGIKPQPSMYGCQLQLGPEQWTQPMGDQMQQPMGDWMKSWIGNARQYGGMGFQDMGIRFQNMGVPDMGSAPNGYYFSMPQPMQGAMSGPMSTQGSGMQGDMSSMQGPGIRLGAVPNPLSHRMPSAELARVLERAQPRLIMGSGLSSILVDAAALDASHEASPDFSDAPLPACKSSDTVFSS